MNRKLTILFTILAEVCSPYYVESRRTRSTPKMALRHMVENINWTQVNLEFQEEFEKVSVNVPFHIPETTVLPTLKYQRGINLTAYAINIRKEQAKLDKVIATRQKEIDAREVRWQTIKTEIDSIKKNISALRQMKQKDVKNKEAMARKKQLLLELRNLKAKYNITSPNRNNFDFAYQEAKHNIMRLLKKHVRFIMNKTKYFHEFILRKNELSDELYDLRDNMTKLDMLINEELEQEYVVRPVRIKDIVVNLTKVVESVNVKGYRYRRAKSDLKYLVHLLNRFLNKTKYEHILKKGVLPDDILKLNAEIRNISNYLKVTPGPELRNLQALLREKDEEYHDEKYDYYRHLLKLRETKMEHLIYFRPC
ncbi:hypothetical protein WDU94_000050 [Cyamophila willieti]